MSGFFFIYDGSGAASKASKAWGNSMAVDRSWRAPRAARTDDCSGTAGGRSRAPLICGSHSCRARRRIPTRNPHTSRRTVVSQPTLAYYTTTTLRTRLPAARTGRESTLFIRPSQSAPKPENCAAAPPSCNPRSSIHDTGRLRRPSYPPLSRVTATPTSPGQCLHKISRD